MVLDSLKEGSSKDRIFFLLLVLFEIRNIEIGCFLVSIFFIMFFSFVEI